MLNPDSQQVQNALAQLNNAAAPVELPPVVLEGGADESPAADNDAAADESATPGTLGMEAPARCEPGSRDLRCLDRCSTTYGVLAQGGRGGHDVRACVFSARDTDPVARAIDGVIRSCRARDEDAYMQIWRAMGCMANPSEAVRNTIGATDAQTSDNTQPQLRIESTPEYLRSLYQQFTNPPQEQALFCGQAIVNLANAVRASRAQAAQGSATPEDAQQCTFKGAVVCSTEGPNSDTYRCGPKTEAGENQPGAGAGACAGRTGVSRQLCEFGEGVNERVGQVEERVREQLERLREQQQRMAQQAQQQLRRLQQQQQQRPPQGQGGDRRDRNADRCPEGYEETREGNRIICTRDSDSEAPAPQCTFIASKDTIQAGETVTLRWRTANAESVRITNLGGNVTDTNGQRSVTPDETTTYELTAVGRDGDGTTSCDVTVTVEGEGGGDDPPPQRGIPPQLSCSPPLIERDGGEATIQWACPTRATESVGEGFDTGGAVADRARVAPEFNTRYGVSCVDDAGEEIGSAQCVVRVGEPVFDIIAEPDTAGRGERVRISWGSLFMRSCRVQGPRGFDYERTEGVVLTEPFTTDTQTVPNRNITAAIYTISCESVFGDRTTRDVTVQFQE